MLFEDRSPIIETSGNVHQISKPAELDALLSSNKYAIIDFYADWCPPCRTISPIFSKLADEYASKGQLAFAKVNVDKLNGIAKRYDITAMPTFVSFADGKPTPVAVQNKKRSTPTETAKDESVERIRGANVVLLRGVVQALAEKVQG